LPQTTRGYGMNVSTTAKGGDFLFYGVGKVVVQRSLADFSVSRLFTEHKAKVNVARVSPNGALVASGDDEGNVIIWEIIEAVWGKVKTTIPINGNVLDIDWSDDSKKIVAVGAGEPNKAKVVTIDSGNTIGKIEGHSKPILSVSHRQQRPYKIATGAEDLLVNWYEGPPFKYVKALASEHIRYPNCVRFSPDGKYLATVGADSKIFVFDGASGEKLKALEDKDGHKAAIYSFCWSPDSKRILTGAADKFAKLWDIESGAVVRTYSWLPKADVGDMLVSCFWHKGAAEYVGVISLSGAITILDIESADKPKAIVHGSQCPVLSLFVDRAGGAFYIAGQDGQVSRYEFKTGLSRWLGGKGHGKAVNGVGLSGDKLVTVGLDDKLRFNDLKSFEFNGDAVALGGQPVDLACGKKAGSGLVAVALTQKKLVLLAKGEVVQTLDIAYEPMTCDFSNDDSVLAVGGKDKKIHTYRVDGKLAEAEVFSESDRPITNVLYRPGSNLLATVDQDRHLYFYADGKNLNRHGWMFHNANVTAAAWSPSGARFASGAADTNIIIWSDFKDYKDESRITISDAHSGGVDHVGWWDENTVISVGVDRSVRIWNIPPLS